MSKKINRVGHTITHKAVPNMPLGYCHSKIHKGWLTMKDVRKHKCIEKQCNCFEKCENHPYWTERTIVKSASNIMSDIRKDYLKGKISKDVYEKYCREYNKGKSKFLKYIANQEREENKDGEIECEKRG